MLNKLTIIYYFIIITCLTGCSSTKVQVYLRDDVKSDKSNIVAFPALLLNNNGSISPANTEYSNLLIDGIFSKKWSESIKEGTVYPVPKKVLDGIPNAYKALDTVITNFDSVSAIEQTTGLTNLFDTITKQIGDGAFAFALFFENEDQYKSSNQLNFNMGLFDTKKMTWKWITKAKYEGPPIPYEMATQDTVDKSFEELYNQNILEEE